MDYGMSAIIFVLGMSAGVLVSTNVSTGEIINTDSNQSAFVELQSISEDSSSYEGEYIVTEGNLRTSAQGFTLEDDNGYRMTIRCEDGPENPSFNSFEVSGYVVGEFSGMSQDWFIECTDISPM